MRRDATHSETNAVVRCQSVCPSVTFMYYIETIKHTYSQTFSPSGVPVILVFRTKRYVECRRGGGYKARSSAVSERPLYVVENLVKSFKVSRNYTAETFFYGSKVPISVSS